MAAELEPESLEDMVLRLRGRLLDLTSRNRILNFRHTAKDSLRIIDVSLTAAFNAILLENAVEFEPVPTPSGPALTEYWRAMGAPERTDLPNPEDYAKFIQWNVEYKLPIDAPDQRERLKLRSLHYAADQEKLLRRIRNRARQIERDIGAHLLFLAFGFIEWIEARGGGTAGSFLAPLLLVPVELEEVSRGAYRIFRLRRGRGEIETNPVLWRKLDVDFRLKLQSLNDESEFTAWFYKIQKDLADHDQLSLQPFLTLGLFHFGGYPLWADLDPTRWQDSKGPAAAPLVRQVFGVEPIPDRGDDVPRDGDALAEAVDLWLPLVLDADCSQGRALALALAGQTMVIEGPPGTGKSQTIANLIAASLMAGKRVLFVSAKRPALDVVLRRLAQVKLDVFCLDLHGDNATVAHILEKVKRAREDRGEQRNVSTGDTQDDRKATWYELSEFRKALLRTWHEQRAWQIFLQAGALKLRAERAGIAAFIETLSVDTSGAQKIAGRAALREIVRAFAELGCLPSIHPFRGVDGTKVLAVDRERLIQSLNEWRTAALELERLKDRLLRAGGHQLPDLARLSTALEKWNESLEQLARARAAASELGKLLGVSLPFSAEAVRPILTIGTRAGLLVGLSLDLRHPSLLDDDCVPVLKELSQRIEAFIAAKEALDGLIPWPPAEPVTVQALRAAVRELRAGGWGRLLRPRHREARKLAERLGLRGMREVQAEALERLAVALEKKSEVDTFAPARALLREGFRGVDTNVEGLLRLRDWIAQSREELEPYRLGTVVRRLFLATPADLKRIVELAAAFEPFAPFADSSGELIALLRAKLPSDLQPWCIDERDRLTKFLDLLADATEQHKRVEQLWAKFVAETGLDQERWFAGVGTDVRARIARVEEACAAADTLAAWLSWDRARRTISCPVARALVAKVEAGALKAEHLPLAYEYLLALEDARLIARSDQGVCVEDVQRVARLSERFAELDQRAIAKRAELIADTVRKTPEPIGKTGLNPVQRTEASLLTALCAQKQPRIKVRELVERAFGALSALMPCFMMSPIAVAQFLPRRHGLFDILVVDEASQLTQEEAVGALARANQAVIVGDSKQLPPTYFFKRIGDDSDDEQEERAGISIMERIKQQNVPSPMLKWHYRSQHESLVMFSNVAFYNGELVVFPSAHGKDPRYGVAWHYIEGGTFIGRKNEREADAIVSRILEHLNKDPDRSLGVVAMNLEQAEVIEELLAQRLRDQPRIIDRLEDMRVQDEPFFIKNLENVQGDERDVILLSMTYGPERPNGPVPQRFGPVGNEEGWRRLNVLVTRARQRLEVFSSMRADDIVYEGAPRGRQALYHFLLYAEKGRLPSSASPPPVGGEAESLFEEEVKRALEARGLQCVCQLRAASFRIDIAVRDPTAPGRFLLGIECDGASFHSAASARERDRLRQRILEGLGWTIHRVWSTDWFENPERELSKILARIEELQQRRARRVLEAVGAQPSSAPRVEPSLTRHAPSPVDGFRAQGQGLGATNRAPAR